MSNYCFVVVGLQFSLPVGCKRIEIQRLDPVAAYIYVLLVKMLIVFSDTGF